MTGHPSAIACTVWSQARYKWILVLKIAFVLPRDKGVRRTLCFRGVSKLQCHSLRNFSERARPYQNITHFPFQILLGNRAQSRQPCHGARVLVVGIGVYRPIICGSLYTKSVPKIFSFSCCSLYFHYLLVASALPMPSGYHSFEHSC